MANYPSAPVSFQAKVDLQDIVRAADINVLYSEVTAIAADLGTGTGLRTSGTWGATTSMDVSTLVWSGVGARLQNIENGLYQAYSYRVDKRGGTVIQPSTASTVGLTLKNVTLTASVTAASASGANSATYTAANTFATGQTVTVTGLGVASGVSLNVTGTVSSATSTQFTLASSVITGASTASGTGVATLVSGPVLSKWTDGQDNVVAQIDAQGNFKAASINGGTP